MTFKKGDTVNDRRGRKWRVGAFTPVEKWEGSDCPTKRRLAELARNVGAVARLHVVRGREDKSVYVMPDGSLRWPCMEGC